jgi:Lar family restriction alleviation protein
MPQFDLKPCPFCGSEKQNVFPPTCTIDDPYDPADRAYPIVSCYGCFTDVPGKDWDRSQKTAVEKWNTRAALSLAKSEKQL